MPDRWKRKAARANQERARLAARLRAFEAATHNLTLWGDAHIGPRTRVRFFEVLHEHGVEDFHGPWSQPTAQDHTDGSGA